jgi:hypothetical protein
MHKAQLVGNYELAFYSAIAAQKMYYGVAPTFAASLPKLDMRAKHDRCVLTCCISRHGDRGRGGVGNSPLVARRPHDYNATVG